jgi:acyl CoA:acetate/3-ketoacid CoA transferase beta subunit
MGEAVNGIIVKVFIQENGIIRLDSNGQFIARLDGITYEEVKEQTETK